MSQVFPMFFVLIANNPRPVHHHLLLGLVQQPHVASSSPSISSLWLPSSFRIWFPLPLLRTFTTYTVMCPNPHILPLRFSPIEFLSASQRCHSLSGLSCFHSSDTPLSFCYFSSHTLNEFMGKSELRKVKTWMDPLHHCFPNEDKLNLSFLFHIEKLERFHNCLKILLSKTLSSLNLQPNFRFLPLSNTGFQHKSWG